MNLSFQEKTAIVTGGSKGIGKGIAKALAGEGCNMVICARHKDELDKTAKELEQSGAEVLPVVADLMKESDIEKIIEKTVDRFGNIDILVHNAGTIGLLNHLKRLPPKHGVPFLS